MSIASEITRISGNIADAYTACSTMGATMPVTENSDNLATTIATIPTGGGTPTMRGSWVVPQAVLDLESAFDTWTQTFTASRKYLYGVLFHKGIGRVLLDSVNKNTGLDSVMTSEGGTVTWDSASAAYVDFTNQDADDNWIVYEYTMQVGESGICKPYTLGTTALVSGTIRYVIMKDNQSDSTVLNKDVFNYFGGLKSIESAKSINIKFGANFIANDLRGYNRRYIPPITNWTNATVDSSFVSNFASYAHTLPNLPYGLDLSSVTTNLSLGTTDSGMNNIREAYIKLPNANFTITNNSGIIFSRENWQYIADNAPTVSGKTLTMGNMNIAICGGSSGSIITALNAKGWTVA